MHSHGERNVTVGARSLPNVEAMTANAANANHARLTALAYTTLLLSRGSNFETREHKGDVRSRKNTRRLRADRDNHYRPIAFRPDLASAVLDNAAVLEHDIVVGTVPRPATRKPI
jgi:hypothetical protein